MVVGTNGKRTARSNTSSSSRTPEYYYNLRAKRDLLPIEKKLGMVRDPDYEYKYTCDNKTPLKYSIALYSFIIILLYLFCINITIPEPDKPIVL